MKRNCLVIFLILFLLSPSQVQAAKKRVVKTAIRPATTTASASRGVKAWVRLRPDRLALLINFSGFGGIKSGSYELTYSANGIGQGAGGTVLLGDTSTKTLLFGTCSKGVCTYHKNITGARLRITSTLTSGQKVIKSFRINV